MAIRKPHIGPDIPTAIIDQMVGRLHVSATGDTVAVLIRGKIRPKASPRQVRQSVRYAQWRHIKNRQLYGFVVSGGHGFH